MDKTKAGSDFLKEINVADVIYWTADCWDDAASKTIVKCFRRCNVIPVERVLNETEEVAANDAPEDTAEISEEMDELAQESYRGSFNNVVESEQDIATCDTESAIDWDMPAQELLEIVHKDGEDTDDEIEIGHAPNFSITLETAASYIDQLTTFALERGFAEVLGPISKGDDAISKHIIFKRQETRQRNI